MDPMRAWHWLHVICNSRSRNTPSLRNGIFEWNSTNLEAFHIRSEVSSANKHERGGSGRIHDSLGEFQINESVAKHSILEAEKQMWCLCSAAGNAAVQDKTWLAWWFVSAPRNLKKISVKHQAWRHHEWSRCRKSNPRELFFRIWLSVFDQWL